MRYESFEILALLVALALMMPAARRLRLPAWRLLITLAIVAWAGLTGAILYNLAEARGLEQFGWSSYGSTSLRYPGGVIAALLAMPIVRLLLPRHVSLASYLDLIAPAAAVALAVLRGGCFVLGCCYGLPSTVPWALAYRPGSQVARHHALQGWVEPGAWSLPVHPLHLYFGAASLVVGLILLGYRSRRRFEGEVFLLYLVLHEGTKGLLELMRGHLPTQSVSHLRVAAFALAGLGGLVMWLRLRGWFVTWLPAIDRDRTRNQLSHG